MEAQIKTGGVIQFDITNVEDMQGVLNGTGEYADSVTSVELRYLKANWDRFQNSVNFYRNGSEVPPPWN